MEKLYTPLLKILLSNYGLQKAILANQARIISNQEGIPEDQIKKELMTSLQDQIDATMIEFTPDFEEAFPGFRESLLNAIIKRKMKED